MSAAGRRVFLTGATGFIGGRLARRLARRGFRLRCLVREQSDTTALEELGAEFVIGDVAEITSFRHALADVDLAYHLAAIYDVGVVDADALERVNVRGTRAFLQAIAQARTPRAIHVSSTVALGPVPHGTGDEHSRHDGRFRSVYERTKVRAHRLAEQAQHDGAPLIIACPALVYGPGDRGPTGRFVDDLLQGRLAGLLADPAWFSFVHVDDVAHGLELMADAGSVGETYILAGEPASMNDFAEQVAALAGTRTPRLRFPLPVARLAGAALDVVTRLTGRRFSISREAVEASARERWVYSYGKAREELGWEPMGLREGLVAGR